MFRSIFQWENDRDRKKLESVRIASWELADYSEEIWDSRLVLLLAELIFRGLGSLILGILE